MFDNLGSGLGRVMTLDTGHRRSACQVAILRDVIDVTEGDDTKLRFRAKRVHILWFTASRRRILCGRLSDRRYRSKNH